MKMSFTSFLRVQVSLVMSVMLFIGMGARADVVLTALHGTEGANSSEGYASLVDGKSSTKWCVKNFTQAYVVMKADQPIVPTAYYLTTGNDTGGNPSRNWSSWQLYGANFSSDSDATEDTEAWVLVDEKTDVSVEELPDANLTTVGFGIDNVNAAAYTYYKLVVTGIRYGGDPGTGTMQMADFSFDNPVTVTYTALSGVDGFSAKEGYASLIDGTGGTKWCSNKGDWFIVFKASDAIAPAFYSLFTANDTQKNAGRNWKSWKVYGANFESDEQATRDATEWMLMDQRQNVGTDRLPAVNLQEFYFGLSEKPTEKYKYFKIEIPENVSGIIQQMGDFAFGQKSKIALVRNNFYQAAAAYDLTRVALKSLTDEYAQKLSLLQFATDVEDMALLNVELDALKKKITTSAEAYAAYQTTVDDVKAYLAEHPEMSSTGRKILQAYVETNAAPSETYPNGTYLYIIEQQTMTEAQLTEEITYLYDLLQKYADGSNDGIDVTYMAIEGTAGTKSTEEFGMLVDGDRGSKWCMKPFKGDCYIIFQASEAIKPTYYCLTTGNDTGGNAGRNWKSWKIYGANFSSEGDVTRESDAWTLIDEKSNIGTDQLPAANTTDAYLYLSGKAATPYEYFKIEITQIMSGEIMQMAEFNFGNQGNFMTYRNDYYEECADFDTTVVCRRKLINEYNDLLYQLKSTNNINTLKSLYQQLLNKQAEILTSAENYANYIAEIEAAQEFLETNSDIKNPSVDFLKKYLNEDIAPGETYPNGSYEYIIRTCALSDYDITNEAKYVQNLLNAAMIGGNVALRGSGGYSSSEGFSALIDGYVSTKWAGNFGESAYAVFKTPQATTPFFYTLTTANDAETYPGRNWKTWSVYGANFDSDDEATRDADGWTLLDKREGVGEDRVYKKNFTNCYFGFSEENTTAYQYYKVELTAVASGSAQQMSEMSFGTQDDFMAVHDSVYASLSEYNQEVTAKASLLEDYAAALQVVNDTEDMESLMLANLHALALQDSIAESVKAYEQYKLAVEDVKAYLEEHDGELAGQYLNKLTAYIEDYIEPNETYPNGSFDYIVDVMALTAEQLATESAIVKQMLDDAVKFNEQTGSIVELTLMLENPTFEKGYDGWQGKQGTATANNGKIYVNESYGQTFNVSQTLTGLKNGLYEFHMKATYRPGDDIYCNNYAAMVYANGNVNYVQSEQEDGVAEDDAEHEVNCYLPEDGNSETDLDFFNNDGVMCYAPNRAKGAIYAFGAGRYDNRVMVNVTDGTLTIGIKDLGTGAGKDWTAFTDARLYYCGELASDASATPLDNTLAEIAKRATMIAEADVDEGNYWMFPNFSAQLRESLLSSVAAIDKATTNEQKYALIEQFSALFQEVYDCKQGYSIMAATVDNLLDIASDYENRGFTEEQYNDYYNLYDEIWANYSAGTYSTEEVQNQTMFRGNTIYASVYGEKPIMSNGVYQLANAMNLRWFTTSVNSGSTSINAVLANDIDMSALTNWSPIGTNDNRYMGTFDGQGHTITGFFLENPGARAGFFGHVYQAQISNFSIEGSLICNGDGNGAIGYSDASTICNVHSALNVDATASGVNHTGGVLGQALNNSVVERCSYSGTMTVGTSQYDCFAGICGYTNTATFDNCANYGSITFGRVDCYAGGIVGYINNTSNKGLHGCLNVGSVQYTGNNPSYSGAFVGWLRGYTESNFTDCYWLEGSAKRASGGNTLGVFHSQTATEMASGAICYALNEATGETIWYQTLGEDAYPVLDATHKTVSKNADGTFSNKSEIRGDLNGDGMVDGSDIVLLVNMVITGDSNKVGDLNGDGTIDGDDLVKIVSITINKDEAEVRADIRRYYLHFFK